jgi:hypothetical protein
MTTEQKRIKIAEACGYKKGWNYGTGYPSSPSDEWCVESLPDYFHDLNAMHEAEKFIKGSCSMWSEYGNQITALCAPRVCYGEYGSSEVADVAHATASQRAEAFGKALNLW